MKRDVESASLPFPVVPGARYWPTLGDPGWPVVSCPPGEDRCRHEMASETDIRQILARYGPVGAFSSSFGVQDFDSDMTLDAQRVFDAREAYLASDAFRAVYPSWESMQEALAAGKAVYDQGELFVVEVEGPQSGPSASATGQAEGAPGGKPEVVTQVTESGKPVV